MQRTLLVLVGVLWLLGALTSSAGWASLPKNPHGPLGELECDACHSVEGWSPLKDPLPFDHDNTEFPLDGAHLGTSCASCHAELRFEGTPTECLECHREELRGTLEPDHRDFEPVERLGDATLVRCTLETGRTHQIRVHLAERAGAAILADKLYGQTPGDPALRAIAEQLGRQALHANVLGFLHPITGERCRWESPLPQDMQAALEALRARS